MRPGSAGALHNAGWVGLSSKQTTGRFGSALLDIEVEHILHAGDVLGVNLREMARSLLLPRLEMVLGQASADGLAREMCSR